MFKYCFGTNISGGTISESYSKVILDQLKRAIWNEKFAFSNEDSFGLTPFRCYNRRIQSVLSIYFSSHVFSYKEIYYRSRQISQRIASSSASEQCALQLQTQS
ncbi:Hypothetical_protein [Hexamita inflata]|uniref:Hypothetical_protein n=1 Tax=Hexamita inflata TaxID=28002 RepID=A0AA86QS13_9EUKA|nr:Hypothetical protein HINF_LOCUS51215 [Hexamita inflata]